MNPPRRSAIPFLACLVALCVAAPAGAEGRYALAELGRDSEGANDAYLELTLPPAPNQALTVGAGATSGSDADSVLLLGRVAVRTDRAVSPEAGYQYWGEHGALTTHTFTAGATWKGNRGRLRVAPQVRLITIRTEAGVTPRRTISSSSVGVDSSADLYLGQHWDLTGAATIHAYEDDPARLTTQRAAQVLSSSSMTLASGLLDRYLMAGGGVTWHTYRIGLERSSSVYAADGARATGTALRLDAWALPGGLDLGLTLGRVRDSVGTVGYARVLVGHGW